MNRILKKRKYLFALLLAVGVTTGCTFSEECSYTGDVEPMLDWDVLWTYYLPRTDSLVARFYNEETVGTAGTVTERVVRKDYPCREIPAGPTRMLVCNRPVGIELKENGEPYPELCQTVYYDNGNPTVKECPLLCVATQSLEVPVDGTIYPLINPRPVVRQISLTLNVRRNVAMGRLSSVNASLSGVPTAYSVGQWMPVRSEATLFLSFNKGEIQTEGDTDRVTHSFYVLGVNPDVEGQAPIARKLNLALSYEKGGIRAEGIDLGGMLNEFTQDVFLCEIDIEQTSPATKVSVVGWKQKKFILN